MTTFLIIIFCVIGFIITQFNTIKNKAGQLPKNVKESLLLGKTESVSISKIILNNESHFQYVVKINQQNYKVITLKDFSNVIITGVDTQYIVMKDGVKYLRLHNNPDLYFIVQSIFPAE